MDSVSRGLALVVTFGLGAAVGFVTAQALSAEQPARPPATANDPRPVEGTTVVRSDPELARAIRQLGEVLEGLEFAMATSTPASVATGARTDAAPSAASQEALLQSFREISSSLRSMNRGQPGAGTPTDAGGLVPPAWVDRETAFGFLDVAALLNDEEGSYERADQTLRSQHMFWSQQDILTRYGKPDSIEAEGSVTTWYYEDVRRIDGLGKADVWFYFNDGLVFSGEFDVDHYD